mgnify:FL=1
MKKSFISILLLLATVFSFSANAASVAVEATEQVEYQSKTMSELVASFYDTTGLKALLEPQEGLKGPHGEELTVFAQSGGRILMILICFILFYLAIKKGFEPLLLIPI